MKDISTFMKEMFINEAKAALLNRSFGPCDHDDASKAMIVSTPEEMDAVLINENVGELYVYMGTTNEKYTHGMLYQVTEE